MNLSTPWHGITCILALKALANFKSPEMSPQCFHWAEVSNKLLSQFSDTFLHFVNFVYGYDSLINNHEMLRSTTDLLKNIFGNQYNKMEK